MSNGKDFNGEERKLIKGTNEASATVGSARTHPDWLEEGLRGCLFRHRALLIYEDGFGFESNQS